MDADISPYQITAQLIIQIFVIITLAGISDVLTHKASIPRVIGYIVVGIIIGPFLLGALPLGSIFPQGLFPSVNISMEGTKIIRSLAIVASVILLFRSGLETDVALFLRYALKGSIIGFFELSISFFAGYFVSVLFAPNAGWFNIMHFFMGSIAMATSVAISTTVLSNHKKMNSAEGVTILSASILDDVMGIIVLAIITGISEIAQSSGTIPTSQIIAIGLKAFGLWLGCTTLGIIFARKFGKGLKSTIKSTTHLSIFVLGIAFFVGGLFESVGISMIIGAYIVGLTLSNTDLSYVIQEKLMPIFMLFIPIFFVVSGMNIDIHTIISKPVLILGLTYSLVCIIAKFLGSSGIALCTGFTPIGAARIGMGMIPRGEVSLIVASMGLGSGIINSTMYNAIMMMIVITSFTGSLGLTTLLNIHKQGTKKQEKDNVTKSEMQLGHAQLARFIILDFLTLIEEEGFFVSKTVQKNRETYHIRRDVVFLTLQVFSKGKIVFLCDEQNIPFFKTVLYEASTNIAEAALSLKKNTNLQSIVPSQRNKDNKIVKCSSETFVDLSKFLSPYLIQLPIQSNSKDEVIRELVALLNKGGYLKNEDKFLKDIFEREKTFSTGMEHGVALPHARSEACKELKIVIGCKPEGIDFNSLDSQLSTIFVLIAAPENYPHVSILAKISSLLNSESFRTAVLQCKKETDVIKLFTS